MAISDALRALPATGRIGLFAARKADLNAPVALNETARAVLTSRGLDEGEQAALTDIYSAGRGAIRSGTALDYIKSLDTQSLTILQESTWTGKPLDLGALSEEQAENLLVQPGDGIDSNNDGTVETVDGGFHMFPPLNAPDAVKTAWSQASAGGGPDGDGVAAVGDMVSDWLDTGDTADPAGRTFGDPAFDWSGFTRDALAKRPTDGSAAGEATRGLLQRFADALKSAGFAA